jgi:ribosomal protein S17
MADETTTITKEKKVRHRLEKIGIVTSAKMQKTIVVEVRRRVAHPGLQTNHDEALEIHGARRARKST